MAHRCIEWDGWEEGLVDSILGPEEQEDDWFKTWDAQDGSADAGADSRCSPLTSTSPTLTESLSLSDGEDAAAVTQPVLRRGSVNRVPGGGKLKVPLPVKVAAEEKEKEKLLNSTGDFCGGRGGELGRRLEAWLCVNGDAEGRVELPRRWDGEAAADKESPT
jgi:hypothetical protein